jgi:hypothetical protein
MGRRDDATRTPREGTVTLRPNGTRATMPPETFGEALAFGMELVAEELDELRDGVTNGNRGIIEGIGSVKASLGGLQEEFHEARAETTSTLGRIEKLLGELAADLEQHQKSVGERLGKLERGASNGHAPAV